MRRVKRRTFREPCVNRRYIPLQTGFRISDMQNQAGPVFLTAEEREQHKLGISRRRHARIFQPEFQPDILL